MSGLIRWFVCRRRGHAWHPDPGDFVLYCTRCHLVLDPYDLFPEPVVERAS